MKSLPQKSERRRGVIRLWPTADQTGDEYSQVETEPASVWKEGFEVHLHRRIPISPRPAVGRGAYEVPDLDRCHDGRYGGASTWESVLQPPGDCLLDLQSHGTYCAVSPARRAVMLELSVTRVVVEPPKRCWSVLRRVTAGWLLPWTLTSISG
jgi:hypothetical protein